MTPTPTKQGSPAGQVPDVLLANLVTGLAGASVDEAALEAHLLSR